MTICTPCILTILCRLFLVTIAHHSLDVGIAQLVQASGILTCRVNAAFVSQRSGSVT